MTQPVFGVLTVQSDRQGFLEGLNGVQVETYTGAPSIYLNDDLNQGDIVPIGLFGLSAAGFSTKEDEVGVGGHRMYFVAGGFNDYESYTIHFPEPADAFGADFRFPFPDETGLTARIGSDEIDLTPLVPADGGFVGFISSTPFDRITLLPTQSAEPFWSMDDLTIGLVPEPSSFAGPLLLLMRRSRKTLSRAADAAPSGAPPMLTPLECAQSSGPRCSL